MSRHVKDRKDNREKVGMRAVWLLLAGLTVACLTFLHAIIQIFGSPVTALLVGGLMVFGMFKMTQHILRLSKQPE